MCNICNKPKCGGGCTISTRQINNSNSSIGRDGESAYQTAVRNGYTGTEAEWLLSLKGSSGSPGQTGPQGPVGPQGPTGPQGPAGEGSDTTASNALHIDETSGDVKLGGILLEETKITGTVEGLRSETTFSQYQTNLKAGADDYSTASEINVSFNQLLISSGGFADVYNSSILMSGENDGQVIISRLNITPPYNAHRLTFDGNGIVFEDTLTNKGAGDKDDYSANKTDYSYITKKWANNTFIKVSEKGDFVDKINNQIINGFKHFNFGIIKDYENNPSSEVSTLIRPNVPAEGINSLSGSISLYTRTSDVPTGSEHRIIIAAENIPSGSRQVLFRNQSGWVLVQDQQDYEFADNAAAIAGGLPLGTVYRTGDVLKIVHAASYYLYLGIVSDSPNEIVTATLYDKNNVPVAAPANIQFDWSLDINGTNHTGTSTISSGNNSFPVWTYDPTADTATNLHTSNPLPTSAGGFQIITG